MKQSELANDLRAQTEHLVKIGRETSVTLEKVSALEEALRNSGDVSPEVETALGDLKTQAQTVDDLVPDVPAAGTGGAVSASGGGQPTEATAAAGTAPSGTVVDDAVAQAAAKATTALGEVKDAVAEGGDVAGAISDLKTAHAELAGVTGADVAEAHGAVTDAVATLEAVNQGEKTEDSGQKTAAAVDAVVAAHNDLIEAASGSGAAAAAGGEQGAKGEAAAAGSEQPAKSEEQPG